MHRHASSSSAPALSGLLSGVVAVLVPVLLVWPASLAGQALPPDQANAVAEIFQDLGNQDLGAPESPGASVAVIRNGAIVYSAGFGSAQIEYQVPVMPSTIFHVASVSKQFTAMAVLLLEADGRLSLDDDIRSHMPEVPDMGHPVTVRHLLHHTSGVRDQWELLAMAGWRLDDVITKEHVRRMLSLQRELNFPPGEEYLYSNMGFSMLADLVERVSGQPFSEFLQARVLAPLDMTSTHVHDDHQMVVPGRAYSYRAAEDGYTKAVLSYANHGATSLFTTADDLARWLDNFRHQRIGGAAVLDRMTTPGVLNGGDTITYALGVVTGTYRGASTVSHGGADAGFRSNVMWFPEHETGIAVLSNLASANPGLRARRVADVVLGDVLEPMPGTEAEPEPAGDQEPEAETWIDVDPEILESYAGRFRAVPGTLSFEVREGRLWVTVPEEAALVARSRTTFAVEGAAAQVTFHVREPGVADSLTLEVEGATYAGVRLPDSAPDAAGLVAYTGTFYSPEIQTLYEISVKDGELVAEHLRHGELPLTHEEEDTFSGPQWFFRDVRFTRDGEGAVDGFRLTGGRVRNLRFLKLRAALPS
jgi:CubicO group peptidase (beta-lactamase class C family)